MASLAQQWKARPVYFLGGLAVATSLDNLLFGVLSVETASYYHWFKSDPWATQSLVGVLYLLNLTQTLATMSYLVLVFVSSIGNFEQVVAYVNVEFELILIIEALVTALAQAFFLKRAYGLTAKSKFFAVVVSLLIVAGLALGLTASIMTITASTGINTDFSTFYLLTNLIITWKCCTVLTDIVLTSTIVSVLIRSKSTFKATNDVVTSLIRFTMEAQIWPLIAGAGFLAFYARDPNANWCLIFSFAESKFCAISVAHVLNSRGRLRRDATSDHSTGRIPGTGREGISVFTERTIHREQLAHSSYETRQKEKAKEDQRAKQRSEEECISLESFERSRSRLAERDAEEGLWTGTPEAAASELSFGVGVGKGDKQVRSQIP